MKLKLIVKVPNQKLGDESFDVDACWTVQQLKTFLSNEYPSKPAASDQKLIYSGHLMKDDQRLLQVFEPLSNLDSVVTIHMVCPPKTLGDQPSQCDLIKGSSNIDPVDPNKNHVPSNLSNNSRVTPHHDDNINRSQNSILTSATSMPSSPSPSSAGFTGNPMVNILNQINHPTLANTYLPYATSAIGAPGVPLSPEEANTLSQLYTRLLSGQPGHHAQPLVGFPSPYLMNPLLMNGQLLQTMMQQQQQPQFQQVPPAPAAQQQPQPLAQPAANLNDVENNGDWLEWLHWLSRFAVLISIVYYYSSLTRFILVISFPIFLFLYQNGMIFSRNNNQRGVTEPHRDRQVRLDDQDRAGRDDQSNARPGDAPDVARAPARPQVESHEPSSHTINAVNMSEERSSSVRIIRMVLSSFLTSLIPEQPQFHFN